MAGTRLTPVFICLLIAGAITAAGQSGNSSKLPSHDPAEMAPDYAALHEPDGWRSAGATLPDAPSVTSSSATSSSAAAASTAATVSNGASADFLNVGGSATSPYTPLTPHQKFIIFLRTTYSPYTFLGATFDAGFAQMSDDWPAYGQGMEGFGKRYGALLADREAGSFFGSFLLPTVMHQDPRYFRLGSQDSIFKRIAYAVSRVGITRDDSGLATFNSSLVASTLLVKGLTNAYYPEPDRGFSDTMGRFGGSLLGTAQTNLLREFLPDMKRIFRKHEPDSIRKLEQKMPMSRTFDPDCFNDPKAEGQAAQPAEGPQPPSSLSH